MTVIADPDKLRQLATRLKTAGQQIEQLQRQAMGALQVLGMERPGTGAVRGGVVARPEDGGEYRTEAAERLSEDLGA